MRVYKGHPLGKRITFTTKTGKQVSFKRTPPGMRRRKGKRRGPQPPNFESPQSL